MLFKKKKYLSWWISNIYFGVRMYLQAICIMLGVYRALGYISARCSAMNWVSKHYSKKRNQKCIWCEVGRHGECWRLLDSFLFQVMWANTKCTLRWEFSPVAERSMNEISFVSWERCWWKRGIAEMLGTKASIFLLLVFPILKDGIFLFLGNSWKSCWPFLM